MAVAGQGEARAPISGSWRRYGALLRNAWKGSLNILLAGTLITVLATAAVPKSYSSVSTAMVVSGVPITTPGDALAANDVAKQRVQAYVALARNKSFTDAVASDLAGTPAAGHANDASVEQLGETAGLRINSVAPTPELAQAVTRSWTGILTSQVASLEANDGRQPLRIQVVNNASLSTTPVSPSRNTNYTVGAVLSLLAALSFALWRTNHRAAVDRLAKGRVTWPPVLVSVPEVAERVEWIDLFAIGKESRADEKSVRAADAFRRLRSVVTADLSETANDVVFITGTSPNAQALQVATGLAMALAREGTAVTLVDADVRHRRLADWLNMPSAPGLAELLTGGVGWEEAKQSVAGMPGLSVVTSGCSDDQGWDRMTRERVARAWATAVSAETMVVAGPSMRQGSDCLTMAQETTKTLLVVDAWAVDPAQIDVDIRELQLVGARLHGLVMYGISDAS